MAAVGPVADQMAFWVVSEGPVATAEAESLPEPPLKVEPDDRRSSSSGGIEDAERGGLGGPAQDGGGEGVSLWLKMRLFCWRRKWRLLGLAVFLAVIIVLAICHDQVMVVWRAYSSWLEANKIAGAISFVFVTALLTVVCFPAAIPTLAAGAIYSGCYGLGTGIAVGTAVVFLGATFGSIISFLLGRYACHGCLEALNKRSRWAKALDAAFQKNGLKVIVLMRLSPVVPYSVFNYLAALTSVRFRDFLVGSFAIIPGCIVFVFLGAQSASAVGMVNDMGHREGGGDVDDPAVRISILVVGVVLAVAAVVLLGYYAKRELRQFMPDLEHMDSDSQGHRGGRQPAADSDAAADLGLAASSPIVQEVTMMPHTPTPQSSALGK